MEWMLENPLPAILFGGLTIVMLGSGWLRTGQQWLLYLIGVAILLTVGAVVLERTVVTDREQVEATLHEIADLVEQNRIEEAVAYAHDTTPQVRRQAIAELSQYEFHRVDIKRNLRIEVFPDHLPPKAVAEFNVLVAFSYKNRFLTDEWTLRFVVVTLLKGEDGTWRVAEYEHHPPTRAYQVDSARGDRGDSF